MQEDAGEPLSDEAQAELLKATFQADGGPALLSTLVSEALAALRFIVTGMWAHVAEDEKEEVDEELEEEDLEGVNQDAIDAFKAEIEPLLGKIGVPFTDVAGDADKPDAAAPAAPAEAAADAAAGDAE